MLAKATTPQEFIKICTICEQEKEIDQYYSYAAACKVCCRERERKRWPKVRQKSVAQSRAWRKANPERSRETQRRAYRRDIIKSREKSIHYVRKSRYGLTPTDFKQLKAEQENRCAICQKESEQLWIDHDHQTGKIRALLCPSCNLLIGKLEASSCLLDKALKYLKKYSKRGREDA